MLKTKTEIEDFVKQSIASKDYEAIRTEFITIVDSYENSEDTSLLEQFMSSIIDNIK